MQERTQETIKNNNNNNKEFDRLTRRSEKYKVKEMIKAFTKTENHDRKTIVFHKKQGRVKLGKGNGGIFKDVIIAKEKREELRHDLKLYNASWGRR